MAVEIERKFLVIHNDWKKLVQNEYTIKQGYLSSEIKRSVRVRIKADKGYLTIKGETKNISRAEYEYEIPLVEAECLLVLCDAPIIEKMRYEVSFGDHLWEIDEFYGENQGLIIAELELELEQEKFKAPEWIGLEVSNDSRYYNSSLVKKPFSQWE